MHEMKFDMSGGAAVLELVAAIAELGLPVRITAVVPATENMPSGRAVKPGDIVTAMNGKTIEVNNTDAEGRLILADSLAYVVEQGAERIVDLATLTGAIIVALGSTYAGVFSNDDAWCAQVEAAMTETGELGWRLPLHPEYFELTKGQYADPDQRRRGAQGDVLVAPRSSCASSSARCRGCTSTSRAPPGAWAARTWAKARRALACACWSSWQKAPSSRQNKPL